MNYAKVSILTIALTSTSLTGATIVDHTFDGIANDTGGLTFQEVTNGVGTGGSSNLSTGLITAGNNGGQDNSTYGFNASTSVDIGTLDPSATGFTIAFDIAATSANVSGLSANGLFFGVVSGTNANGTSGTSLWNNDPHAFGYVAGGSFGTNIMRQDAEGGANDGNSVNTALGGITPTDGSYQDGFTITIGFFDDDTWTITSTGLSTNLNGSGSLTTSGAGILDYAAISADLTPYVSLQGQDSATITINSITVTSIPEPSTALLFGAATLLLMRRRR